MPPEVRRRHLFEMTVVTEAVQSAFKAKKMNVAYLGNALPHVHWNIIPRYGPDPLPHDANWSIDRGFIESVVLPDDELELVKLALTTELRNLAAKYAIRASFGTVPG